MMSQERIMEQIKKHIKEFQIITIAIIPAVLLMIAISYGMQYMNIITHTMPLEVIVGWMGVCFALSLGVIIGLQTALKEVKEYKEDSE